MATTAFHRVLTNALLVTAVVLGATACNKEKPTTVIITVKDTNGDVVPDVLVRLYANPSVPLADASRLKMEATTSGGGKAEFDYTDFYEQGQAGFAVLDILAEKDTLSGEGIIKILEEETNEETVILEVNPD